MWGVSTIARILRNEAYIGRVYFNRTEVVPDRRLVGKTRQVQRPRDQWIAIAVLAILDEEQFEAAQRVSHDNSQWSPRRAEPGHWLLRGLVKCGHCAMGVSCHKMRGRNGTFHRYSFREQARACVGHFQRELVKCDGGGRESARAVSLDAGERRRIQAALAAEGFDPGPADGQYGPKTRRAIQAWQQAKGLAATGELTTRQAEALLGGAAPLEPFGTISARVFSTPASPLRLGESIELTLTTDTTGYGHLYLLNASGQVLALVENLPVAGGVPVTLPPPEASYKLRTTTTPGTGRVLFLVTREPFAGFSGGAAPASIGLGAKAFMTSLNAATARLVSNGWALAETRLELLPAED